MGVMTEKASPQLITTEFDRWWNSSGIWVEPANKRRGGESGVQLLQQRDLMRTLLYCKRQVGHIYRTFLHPFGRPTILRELQAYRAFARLGIKTPNVVYCAARQQHANWQALLVTDALQGFVSLEQWYTSKNSAALTNAVLKQLAATLARLHLAGWQHGCCYPQHIFVKAKTDKNGAVEIDIALLDLEKSRRRFRIKDAARRDLGQLGRHRGNIPETDLLFIHQAYQQALNGPAGMLQP
ncbi:InaA protein [Ectopseudomonas mendocina]|nr:lipopolysaccharide kinase InaA family protein [Pseudomonas mendocina]TRO23068.1 InaA protein [Pseudomonas mendocina]